MSRKSKSTMAVAADDGGGSTPSLPSPTTTHYQQVADNAMKAINDVMAILPSLESSHPATIDFVRGHLSVSPQDLGSIVSHVEQEPRLRAVNTLDPVGARDTLQFVEAFESVGQKFITIGKKIVFTGKARLAALTANAQQTGAVAVALARDPESGFGDVAGNIRRLLNSKKRSPRKKSATVETNQAA